MSNKPFFFRIDIAALFDFATEPEGEGMSLLRFVKELQRGQSDYLFIQNMIDEARNYIEKKRNAGSRGGLAKASSAKAVLKQCHSSALAKASTPLASSSSSSSTEAVKDKPSYVGSDGVIYDYDSFFERLWKTYPRKDGKKEAQRHYNASVKTDSDMAAIRDAIFNYVESIEGKERRFIKNGSTWFNNWKDWIPEDADADAA